MRGFFFGMGWDVYAIRVFMDASSSGLCRTVDPLPTGLGMFLDSNCAACEENFHFRTWNRVRHAKRLFFFFYAP